MLDVRAEADKIGVSGASDQTNGCWSFSGELTGPHLAARIAVVVLRVMPLK